MSSWSVVQSKGGTGDGVSSASVTFTSNVGSNKIIVAVALFGATVSTVKDGAGNNWTHLFTQAWGDGNAGGTELWALDVPAADVGTAPTITVTGNAGTSAVAVVAQEVSGLLTGNTTAMLDGTPVAITGTASGSTGSPAYSSAAAGEYLVSIYGDDESVTSTWTAPSGYTADPNGRNSTFIQNVEIAYKDSTGGAETGAYSTSPGTSGWVVAIVAFQLAASAPSAFSPPLPQPGGIAWRRRFRRKQQTQFTVASGPVTTTGTLVIPGGSLLSDAVILMAPATLAGASAAVSGATQLAPLVLGGSSAAITPSSATSSPATLAGSGSLTGNVSQGAGASIGGSSALAPTAILEAPVTVSGASSWLGNVSQNAGLALAGAGSWLGTATQNAGLAVSGAGSWAATVTQQAIAALPGGSSLTANVTQQVTAALSGGSSLLAKATQIAVLAVSGAATAVFNTAGSVTATISMAAGSAWSLPVVQNSLTSLSGISQIITSSVQAAITTMAGSGSFIGNSVSVAKAAFSAVSSWTGIGSLLGTGPKINFQRLGGSARNTGDSNGIGGSVTTQNNLGGQASPSKTFGGQASLCR